MALINSTQNMVAVGGNQTGLTALAGGGQTGATVLGAFNVIATCATAADSCILPTGATPGQLVFVRNNGAAACNVFPPVGGAINGGSANAAVSVTNAKGAVFWSSDASGLVWSTAALAA